MKVWAAALSVAALLSACERDTESPSPEAGGTAGTTAIATEDASVVNDGSIHCPSSRNCPQDANGLEFAGVVIPTSGFRGQLTEGVDVAGTAPSDIICLGQQTKYCPDKYYGRLWRRTGNQIVCTPGSTEKACQGIEGYAFLCSRDPADPKYDEYCPGVPGKWPKEAAPATAGEAAGDAAGGRSTGG